MLVIIELVTDVVADIANHMELLVESKNMRAVTSFAQFATLKAYEHCLP